MSIESVYGELLGRSPDEGAYGTYSGWSDDQIRGAILGSQEYAERQRPSQQQPQQQQQSSGGGNNIDSLYQQYLGRSPDEGARVTYAGFNDEQIRNAILGSQEYADRQGGGRAAGLPGLLSSSNTPAAPYTPEPSYGEYNFEMTGKPSDVELATNPDMANAWYRFSGTSPAPAMTWETAPSTVTAAPGLISFYGAYGLPKPFSEEDIRKPVDPKTISYGYGNTPYAGVKSNVPGLMSGGEYIVDPKTNKFVLDASGNPIHVPIEPYKQSGFNNIMTNYVIPGLIAAGAIGTGLGAAGLIGEGALAAGAAEGGGASGFGGLTGNSGYAGTGMLGGATGGAGGISIPTTGGALGLNAAAEAAIAAGAGAGLPAAGTSITGAAIGQSLGGVGGLNAALPAAGSSGFGSMSAALAPNTVLGTGLAGGGAIGGSYLLGANGLPATNIFGTPITASSVGIGGYPASTGVLDTLSNALSGLSPTSALTTAALGSTALKAITGGTQTPTAATTTATPSTYAPRGQVGYDPLLSLLAPRLITRNQYSLLG